MPVERYAHAPLCRRVGFVIRRSFLFEARTHPGAPEITKVLRVARLVLHAGKLDFLLLQKKVTSSKAKALQKAP